MNPSTKQRFKEFLCKLLGHKLVYTHTFNNQDHYACTRCGRIISKPTSKEDDNS